jgi:hypothetical protein
MVLLLTDIRTFASAIPAQKKTSSSLRSPLRFVGLSVIFSFVSLWYWLFSSLLSLFFRNVVSVICRTVRQFLSMSNTQNPTKFTGQPTDWLIDWFFSLYLCVCQCGSSITLSLLFSFDCLCKQQTERRSNRSNAHYVTIEQVRLAWQIPQRFGLPSGVPLRSWFCSVLASLLHSLFSHCSCVVAVLFLQEAIS